MSRILKLIERAIFSVLLSRIDELEGDLVKRLEVLERDLVSSRQCVSERLDLIETRLDRVESKVYGNKADYC